MVIYSFSYSLNSDNDNLVVCGVELSADLKWQFK